MLGSLLISSNIDMAEAAFTASFTLSSMRMALMFSAERLIFLGTASSLIMRSKTSTHCLRTFSAVVESPPALEDGKKVNDGIRPSWFSSDVIVVVFKRIWQGKAVVRYMDEEELLKRMTKLLEQGCTMLANHHSCGAPLFRCKGEIICPACSLGESNVPAASVESIPEMPSVQEETAGRIAHVEGEELSPSVPQKGKAEVSDRDELGPALGFLRRALLLRLKDLTAGVEVEGDLDKLHRQLGCIERIVNILDALER